jgi:hypothetical protein
MPECAGMSLEISVAGTLTVTGVVGDPGRRGRGTAWHPDPSGCYLTITQPYMLSTAKCGVTLQMRR